MPPPPQPGKDGWVSLFDGKTLQGWRMFGKEGAPTGWWVEDGVLQGSGKGGDLATVDMFGDFELCLEWRISAGGNSGIILRASEKTGAASNSGPEMQIIDNEGYPSELRAAQMAGSLYDLVPAPEGLDAPAGVWNRVWIRVQQSRYTFALNEVITADLDLTGEEGLALIARSKFSKYPEFGSLMEGPIVLQGHGDPVSFRNILVRRLPEVVGTD